jgi:uncharacterized membrane protein/uncharacterized membrane protein YeaQ/YmgE (transglycosylase-associated protein family)
MEVLISLLTGGIAGWLTRIVMRNPHSGVLGDVVLGSLGGIVGGWLLRVAGVEQPAGVIGHVAVALLGAMLLVGAARLFVHAAERTVSYAGVVGGAVAGALPVADLEQQLRKLGGLERRVISKVLSRASTAHDTNREFEQQLTLGQRVADRVASFGGSWSFIGLFALVTLAWMLFNVESPTPFDPFPFILLNLGLSSLAALQAPVIMMSQNRQAAKDRLEAQHDYEVNLRAELEIMSLHAKMDEMREVEVRRLLAEHERLAARVERLLERDGGR